jgi:Fic family protein
MPKRIAKDDFDRIVEVVSRFPDGASIVDISSGVDLSISRRSLQRRLVSLVENNELLTTGDGKGTRYFVRTSSPELSEPLLSGDGIPLSIESQKLIDAVSKPIQMRKPVGYDRSFLDSYRPNKSFYLMRDTRDRLAAMGHVTEEILPAGTYARQVYNRLLIDLSWNSSRLEGNTYSLLETERLLEFGENATGRSAQEAQMILNHKAAIELIVEQTDEIGFNKYTIMNLHALLSDNLLIDPRACGRLRARRVGISGSTFIPLEGPQLIEERFEKVLETASIIEDPFEQAFFAMVQLPYLQPFEDVNKRVSRLAANIPLVRENYSPLSFVDVPNHVYVQGILAVYELNRVELLRDVFTWAYERSCARYSAITQSLGAPDPFRSKYRDRVHDIVVKIVTAAMNKTTAVQEITQYASREIPKEDRARFVEVVETELMSLHEGNIARYRLRPSEFHAWQRNWR